MIEVEKDGEVINEYSGITSRFKAHVEARKLRAIRDSMCDSLLADPSGIAFENMETYVLKNGISETELYDEHDGREFQLDKSKWDSLSRCENFGYEAKNYKVRRVKCI